MKGTGAGWDSCLYRIFLVGGFLFVIGSTVITAVLSPDDGQMALYVGIGSVSIFVVLIVGYWIVQIVFLGYGSMKPADLSQKRDVNDLSVLGSWNTLFTAMVIEGGDPESMKEAARKGNSSLIIWFLWAAVIALFPILLMVPYAFGLLEWSYIRYGVMFYLGLVVVMGFLSFFLGGRATQAGEEVLLAPLGLKLTGLPNVVATGTGPGVRGATVMEGIRFGRAVRITVELGRVITQVEHPVPGFVVNSRAGDLEAESGAPQAIKDALQKLRKAKRWESLDVSGDKNGITATRNRKGQNMWLYDLWLIERIVHEIEKGRGV
jgi:hypothetical protein